MNCALISTGLRIFVTRSIAVAGEQIQSGKIILGRYTIYVDRRTDGEWDLGLDGASSFAMNLDSNSGLADAMQLAYQRCVSHFDWQGIREQYPSADQRVLFTGKLHWLGRHGGSEIKCRTKKVAHALRVVSRRTICQLEYSIGEGPRVPCE